MHQKVPTGKDGNGMWQLAVHFGKNSASTNLHTPVWSSPHGRCPHASDLGGGKGQSLDCETRLHGRVHNFRRGSGRCCRLLTSPSHHARYSPFPMSLPTHRYMPWSLAATLPFSFSPNPQTLALYFAAACSFPLQTPLLPPSTSVRGRRPSS